MDELKKKRRRYLMDMMFMALANGADPNKTDASGNSRLHVAVKANECDIISLLLEHRANLNQTNHQDLTPLTFAIAMKSNNQTIRLLVESKADINQRNKHGNTPVYALVRDMAIHNDFQHELSTHKCETKRVLYYILDMGADIHKTSFVQHKNSISHVRTAHEELLLYNPQILESYTESCQNILHSALDGDVSPVLIGPLVSIILSYWI